MSLQPMPLAPQPMPAPLLPSEIHSDWPRTTLSPLPDAQDSRDTTSSLDRMSSGSQSRWTGIVKLAGAVALGAAAFFALARSPLPSGDETVHSNWRQHVQPLNERFTQTGESVMKHVNRGGVVTFGTQVLFGELDRDDATTLAVQAALAKGDVAQAEAVIQAAQQIPEPVATSANAQSQAAPDAQSAVPTPAPVPVPVPSLKPTLSEGMKLAVLTGDAKFHHLFLFDSCDEDGDIVEVLVNGDRFGIVPITHRGATISIPISSTQTTNLSIRGLRDGTGGITVGTITSSGKTYLRRMTVGEVQPVELIAK